MFYPRLNAPQLTLGIFRTSQDRFGLPLGSCISLAHPGYSGRQAKGQNRNGFSCARQREKKLVRSQNASAFSFPSFGLSALSSHPRATWGSKLLTGGLGGFACFLRFLFRSVYA
jgi:hypothetical protein